MPKKEEALQPPYPKSRADVIAKLAVLKEVGEYSIALTAGNDVVVVDPVGLRSYVELSSRAKSPLRFLGRVRKVPVQVETEIVSILKKQRAIRARIRKDENLFDEVEGE